MRIVFINHLPSRTASFYRQMYIADYLRERGYDVSMLIRSKPIFNVEFKDHEKIDTIYYWREPFEYMFLFDTIQVIKRIKDADLIYLNRAYPTSATPTFLAKMICKKPLIVDLEDWDAIGGYSSMANIGFAERIVMTSFEEFLPRRCDCVITVSKYLYHRVIAMGIPKYRVFYAPNVADTDLFNPNVDCSDVRERYGLSNRVIMVMGIFYGFEFRIWRMILDIFSLVLKEMPDAQLLIIGWGKGIEYMREMAKKMRIDRCIITPGYVSRNDLPKFIACGTVALHILDRRFFYCHNQSPATIAEFMSMGKPIVATDVEEVYEALNGVGILVRSMNPEDYVEPLMKFLTDEFLKRRYGRLARKRAIKKYSVKALGRVVERACESVLR